MVWEMDWIGSQGMIFSSPISFCASTTSPSRPPQLMAPQWGWNKDNLPHQYRPWISSNVSYALSNLVNVFLIHRRLYIHRCPQIGGTSFSWGKKGGFLHELYCDFARQKKNLTKTRTCRLDYTTSRQKKHLKKDEKEQRQLDGPPRKTPPRCGVGSASTVARGGTKVPSRDPSEVFGQWAAQAPLILHWPVWVRFIKYPIEEPLWQLATTNSCAFACCCHSSVLTWPWSSSTAAGVTYRT